MPISLRGTFALRTLRAQKFGEFTQIWRRIRVRHSLQILPGELRRQDWKLRLRNWNLAAARAVHDGNRNAPDAFVTHRNAINRKAGQSATSPSLAEFRDNPVSGNTSGGTTERPGVGQHPVAAEGLRELSANVVTGPLPLDDFFDRQSYAMGEFKEIRVVCRYTEHGTAELRLHCQPADKNRNPTKIERIDGVTTGTHSRNVRLLATQDTFSVVDHVVFVTGLENGRENGVPGMDKNEGGTVNSFHASGEDLELSVVHSQVVTGLQCELATSQASDAMTLSLLLDYRPVGLAQIVHQTITVGTEIQKPGPFASSGIFLTPKFLAQLGCERILIFEIAHTRVLQRAHRLWVRKLQNLAAMHL